MGIASLRLFFKNKKNNGRSKYEKVTVEYEKSFSIIWIFPKIEKLFKNFEFRINLLDEINLPKQKHQLQRSMLF